MTMTETSPDRRLATARLGSPRVVGRQRPGRHRLADLGIRFRGGGLRGPETGVSDRASYVLAQGAVRFVVTAGLGPDSEVARHVLRHGDGIRHLAWRVDDAEATATLAAAKGATVVAEPAARQDDAGSVTTCGLRDLRRDPAPVRRALGGDDRWGPGFPATACRRRRPVTVVGLTSIDHVVGNVEEGRLDEWVDWYMEVLGFAEMRHFDAAQISTRYSALRSTVVHNGAGIVCPSTSPHPA